MIQAHFFYFISVFLVFLFALVSCSNSDMNTSLKSKTNYTSVTLSSGLLNSYSIEELITKSDVIAIGEVVSVLQSEWGPNYKRNSQIIHTDTIIEVTQYLLGNLDQDNQDRIAIRTWGGQVGEAQYLVEAQPEFSIGEKVVVYLYQLDVHEGEAPSNVDFQAVYGVVGANQGKVTYEGGRLPHEDKDGTILSVEELSERIKLIKQSNN